MSDPLSSFSVSQVVVATRDGQRVDQHFGTATTFQVFGWDGQQPVLLATRQLEDHAQGDEDPRATILRMLADCGVLLVAKIGPTPQEMLAKAGIEASDLYVGKPILDAVAAVFAAKLAAQTAGPVDASAFRLAHAMLRVNDIERSLAFYTEGLGMTVLERRDHKKNQFSQAYLGYGPGFDGMALELVQNWTREDPYTQGDAFGHIAIRVDGITALCDRLTAQGVPMPRPPKAQRHGDNIVAFVQDPDGHAIELVQGPRF